MKILIKICVDPLKDDFCHFSFRSIEKTIVIEGTFREMLITLSKMKILLCTIDMAEVKHHFPRCYAVTNMCDIVLRTDKLKIGLRTNNCAELFRHYPA